MKKQIILFLILLIIASGLITGIVFYDDIKSIYPCHKNDDKEVYPSTLYMQGNYVEDYQSNEDNNDITYNYKNDKDEEDNYLHNPYYDPEFKYVDFHLLEEQQLRDSLELAIQYAIDNYYGVNHNFLFSTVYGGYIQAIKEKLIYDDVKKHYITIREVLPLEDIYERSGLPGR